MSLIINVVEKSKQKIKHSCLRDKFVKKFVAFITILASDILVLCKSDELRNWRNVLNRRESRPRRLMVQF